jgi:hypothetical protein
MADHVQRVEQQDRQHEEVKSRQPSNVILVHLRL